MNPPPFDPAAIVAIARQVRAAIEAVPPMQRPPGLRAFPQGDSSEAAQLLGAYLCDHRILGFQHVRGGRGSKRDDTWAPHAWLQRAGCVIDIAADAFADAPAAVIVADPSAWHAETFQAAEPDLPGDFRSYTGPGLLHVMYGRITDWLAEYARSSGIVPKELP
jgi:hypothetical protein